VPCYFKWDVISLKTYCDWKAGDMGIIMPAHCQDVNRL